MSSFVLSEMMDRDNRDYVTMNNYFGLIAHFYLSGDAARYCARRSLESNKLEVEGLREAREYHYNLCNFPTVDLLERLREKFFEGN